MGTIGLDAESTIASKGEEIRIPIEFIPSTQKVSVHQYSASELDEVKKLLHEVTEGKSVLKKINGIYSRNRARFFLRRYLLSIREEIEKHKRGSAISNYSKLVGKVKIGFSISSDGLFSNVRILDSSGDRLLDRSAREAINKASGKTKRPHNAGRKTLQTSVVIKYQYGL